MVDSSCNQPTTTLQRPCLYQIPSSMMNEFSQLETMNPKSKKYTLFQNTYIPRQTIEIRFAFSFFKHLYLSRYVVLCDHVAPRADQQHMCSKSDQIACSNYDNHSKSNSPNIKRNLCDHLLSTRRISTSILTSKMFI